MVSVKKRYSVYLEIADENQWLPDTFDKDYIIKPIEARYGMHVTKLRMEPIEQLR